MATLIEHMAEKHDENLEVKKQTFQSTREFLIWKETVEKESTSSFAKHRKREGKTHTIEWYRCNRTGTYRPSGTGKRMMKQQGTSKINGYCTAHMKVSTSKYNGEVTIDACLGHVGHTLKLEHLRIPERVRQKIAGNLAKGVTIESILDQIRESTENKISRGHLVDRKDILNIKQQLNVYLMEKDPKDTRSVHYWIRELEEGEFNPVLVYKTQGVEKYSLPKIDFLLGIQTKYQLDKLIKHGSNIICMDSTHKTNQYNFQLISILVIDEFGEGIPVGWLISNREDQLVLYPFLAAIAARAGAIKTTVFVSDEANNFYNAWVLNFPRPENKLICSWHVDKNWRKGLETHISTKDNMADVYAALKTMQFEECEAQFQKQLQQFCTWCEKTYPRFYEYFSNTYVRHVEHWAMCFHVGTGINTNMMMEAFHNALKGICSQRKQNRRIDHLLCKLLKIAQGKVFDGLIKNQKTVAHGLGELESEHSYAFKPKCLVPPNKDFDIQPYFIKTKITANSLSLPTANEPKCVKAKLTDKVPLICGLCFNGDDVHNAKEIEWVECPLCGIWSHWKCDGDGGLTKDYICSICRSSMEVGSIST